MRRQGVLSDRPVTRARFRIRRRNEIEKCRTGAVRFSIDETSARKWRKAFAETGYERGVHRIGR
jgi:hypothetical protein